MPQYLLLVSSVSVSTQEVSTQQDKFTTHFLLSIPLCCFAMASLSFSRLKLSIIHLFIDVKVTTALSSLFSTMVSTKQGETEKSAIAEHAWAEQHHPIWDQTSVIEQAKSVDILWVKEAFCIMMAEKGKLLNRDQVTTISCYWKPLLQQRTCYPTRSYTSSAKSLQSWIWLAHQTHHWSWTRLPLKSGWLCLLCSLWRRLWHSSEMSVTFAISTLCWI